MSRKLTAKGEATQKRIIQGASDVLREKGVALATLDDIMARTQTSKSQLFHYFPGGKDELLLAVARFEAERVLAEQQPYLGRLDSWQAWQNWRDLLVERYEEQTDDCPLGALFLHVGRSTPGARAVVVELMHSWQEDLASGIRALQDAGQLPADLDVEARSAALLAAIQGGVAILQATGQAYHLRVALDEGIAGLRRAARDQAADRAEEAVAAP
ncbi:TetR/AcrR family transcriptional regulator [Streptomyces sp. NPDC048192]|uniref:TetR/AcrR family transcriptional regulator n=1 Tax=Streptomyces sp. NPDC048192 TaxID=3365510 RepID=UPI00371EC402